ncbi:MULTISPECIES: DMT family transporter [unclassified Ruegeria]|uniref:DMT family transporter n=1 Tax=unclassified Ruegeria TaxID=2625375 RepID=UPI0014920BA2|nr:MULTISPECIES: DMT family transporter [unclassified Ruegeria]NOD34110.1 EamA family transporter [Ruegeria sp. HKCCD7296]NOE41134.1 EamA family transporter [Ruegeria sp. HKCCD7319]
MELHQTQPVNSTRASLVLVMGGALWGLYWIPVRFFLDQGLTGPWPGIVMYCAALIALFPFVWSDRHTLVREWRNLMLSGMFTGAAFSLYSISLVYTDVVRSILLFYLTPIWGTLLGVMVLGERLNLMRLAGLFCGLGGLFVVLGGAGFVPWPQNIGDWLALASGVCWALGSMGLYRVNRISISGQVFAFVFGALILSLFSLLVLPEQALPSIAQSEAIRVLLLALLSAFYILPMVYMTIWPATKLSPSRVGLLLMSEVVVGIASAAVLSGEPFGLREFLGAALIVSAAVLEIVRK